MIHSEEGSRIFKRCMNVVGKALDELYITLSSHFIEFKR